MLQDVMRARASFSLFLNVEGIIKSETVKTIILASQANVCHGQVPFLPREHGDPLMLSGFLSLFLSFIAHLPRSK